jgi:DNA-binding cell septation regulator SpoVG
MKIIKLDVINKTVMKAKASIDDEKGLISHEWKIIAIDGKLQVVVPQIRSGSDFIDVLVFTDTKALEEIKALILSAYQNACKES